MDVHAARFIAFVSQPLKTVFETGRIDQKAVLGFILYLMSLTRILSDTQARESCR